jgi:hypothetical protein
MTENGLLPPVYQSFMTDNKVILYIGGERAGALSF